MGGGGVMRTAARAAIGGAYRSSPVVDQIATAGRRAAKPSPANVAPSVCGEAMASASPLMSSASQNVQVGAVMVQQPAWEIDDWVLANGVEEDLLDELQPPPRIVFGSVPTLEEAKEATSDLKDAIEKIYFSSPATECELSRRLVPTQPNNTGRLESGLCTSFGSAALAPASHSVIQAFSLLQQSPEVQSVVASLASDKSVWDAVMKNEKVVEFYKSHQTFSESENSNTNKDGEESAENILDYCTEKPSEKSTESGNGIVRFINAVKLRVSKMVMDLSSLIQDFMGTSSGDPAAARTPSSDSDANGLIGASFLALAVAAILVVLLKRV